MIHEELHNVIGLIKTNKLTRNVAVLILFLSTVISLLFSFLAGLFIFVNYVLGFTVCWFLIRYQAEASFCLHRLASFYRIHLLPHKSLHSPCPICKTDRCTRHRTQHLTPWKNLYVSEELNDAVEHFYNTILGRFVSSWYGNVTKDVTFVNELKVSLRFATSSLVNQILSVDCSRVIAKKLIPCAIKHVDDYLCMRQIANLKKASFDDVAVEYLGKRLHLATTNRNNELSYLRQLTAALLPQVLPVDCMKCNNYKVLIREIVTGWVLLPLMDVLASPHMINSLVILIATYKPKGSSPSHSQSKSVEFLHSFVNKDQVQSSFATDLKSILKTTDLLYAFMQFLKQEGPVHVLQFCLDIEEFNHKLLIPDMSKKQLEILHTEALNIYKIYFDDKSDDYIGCGRDIELKLWQLLQEGVYHVAKLQTSEPLYKAYDFAFNVLEKDWLPQFFHSNEFYSYLCGPKLTSSYTKVPPHGARNKKTFDSSTQGTVAKISSGLGRIKGVLKPNQPVEGSIFTPELYSNNPTTFEEDIFLSDCEGIFRDLSTWRISIPSVEVHQLGSSKSYYIFNIHVQRIDTISDNEIRHWIVQRKDQDFQTLNTKLIEFHGGNEICGSPLPSRRAMMSLETRKVKHENFLRLLLQKPSLRGSDLIHTFLTTDQDFTILVTSAVPVVEDLGNIYQSVAFKLRKEKGQHLDPFVNNFLASTSKVKQNKIELAEVGEELQIIVPDIPPKPATLENDTFKDNFGILYKKVENSSSSSFNPDGFTESLFYLLKHIFKIRKGILKLFAAVCSVAQEAVEKLSRHYIDRKLRTSLSQSNLRDLVVLLEEAIFEPSVQTSKDELEKRRLRAIQELDGMVPYVAQKLLGDNFTNGLAVLLEILQNPLYNKQLVYNLLDIVVSEIYPQVNEAKR
ncbi:sorting nexin-14-like isoform X2 [Photinus pyralis]|uniref:sorting nexin-14-like isoform X2 n=1 Tax=Photinus pyralis TaxID=7054 RepID=UPI001266FEF7|nr:sorting nexin-14-like isoform X2 [Photinus pyralis]